jgi:hypothetical protein
MLLPKRRPSELLGLVKSKRRNALLLTQPKMLGVRSGSSWPPSKTKLGSEEKNLKAERRPLPSPQLWQRMWLLRMHAARGMLTRHELRWKKRRRKNAVASKPAMLLTPPLTPRVARKRRPSELLGLVKSKRRNTLLLSLPKMLGARSGSSWPPSKTRPGGRWTKHLPKKRWLLTT